MILRIENDIYKRKSLEKESCYDACEWTIEPDDYLLYIEGRKLEMTGDIEGAKISLCQIKIV